MRNAYILSSGTSVPDQIISNQYFNHMLEEDVDTWLRKNVQIYNRRWCTKNQSVADLAEAASQVALKRGGVTALEIDLIIIATDTPEFISPATAAVVQDRLGAKNAGTFDVNAACAGFVTAIDIASKYIQADEQYKHILVIGAYAMSKYLNPTDKKTVTLFADGASAVILKAEPKKERGYLASQLLSRGEYNEWMGIYAGGTRTPIDATVLANNDQRLKFVKKFPPTLNPEMWSQMIIDLCKRIGCSPQDVNRYFITQININSIWATLDLLDVPRDRGHTIMHEYGYTGSACIPMAFNDAVENELVKAGDLVLFIGSGGGLAFAGAAFRL